MHRLVIGGDARARARVPIIIVARHSVVALPMRLAFELVRKFCLVFP